MYNLGCRQLVSCTRMTPVLMILRSYERLEAQQLYLNRSAVDVVDLVRVHVDPTQE
jgi:hypothetical protein